VNTFGLKIGGLNLGLDISAMEARLHQSVVEMFSPFLRNGAEAPKETLVVFPARTWGWSRGLGDLESLIEESLRTPLSRFPFASNEERELRHRLRRVLPFLREEKFRNFLNPVKVPQDVTLLPFGRSVLCRREGEPRSMLFQKTWTRKKTKEASLYGSVYFVSAVGLPSAEGLLLHGVGIVEQNCGLLFLGRPGNGKSTLARLSTPREVISDDGIIATRRGGSYYLHATPFNQMESDIPAPNDREDRLVMGIFLNKDEEVRLDRVSPLEACPTIVRNHVHFFRYFSAGVAERTFMMVADLCREIPFYRLHFRKDPSFWPLVEKALAERV
jgi:hypothetical protein